MGYRSIALVAIAIGACHSAPTATVTKSPVALSVPAPSVTATPKPVNEGTPLTATRWPDAKSPSASITLSSFGSKADLIATLRKNGAIDEEPGAKNVWGAGVGDASGATGNMWGSGTSSMSEGLGLGGIGTVGHGAGASTDSVTNVQEQGVDEGGIVKVHGEHLVVLRRGRLFTIRLSDLATVHATNAYAPGVNPTNTWYDEMLVEGDTIVVIGYSYDRGGTEIGLFDLSSDGFISPRGTYQLRSDDYYSSRNYASRLIGQKLVFYAPLRVHGTERAPLAFMPALRKWNPRSTNSDFVPILEPTRIDRPLTGDDDMALHTVTVCDLSKRDMTCKARGVIASSSRVFYVAPDAVYVWTSPFGFDLPDRAARSVLYRMPLGDETATAVRTRGTPIDQFSFREDKEHGMLDVLLTATAAGDAMWTRERDRPGDTAIALVQIPLARFSRTISEVPGSSYVGLPWVNGAVIQNRFVGDHVVYGAGTTWGYQGPQTDGRAQLYKIDGTEAPRTFALGHSVDRIEPIGDDALVVGADGSDLHFSAFALGAHKKPALAGHFLQSGVGQGETRSHGFFYSATSATHGVFGLPLRAGGEAGYRQLVDDSASVLFVDNDKLSFTPLGMLEGRSAQTNDDNCHASCVDWYGNSRPLFVRGRVFALLGYEIVEGKLDAKKITELRRASFAPGPKTGASNRATSSTSP